MKHYLLFIALLASLVGHATGDPQFHRDPNEIRLAKGTRQYDLTYQQFLRQQTSWREFRENHGTWYVHFNEENGLPHRAYGEPIPVNGSSAVEQAMDFVLNHLNAFGVDPADLSEPTVSTAKKHTWVRFGQKNNGLDVLNSGITVKLWEGNVIMFGVDVYDTDQAPADAAITESQAMSIAASGIADEITSVSMGQLSYLPLPEFRSAPIHLVYEVNVRSVNENGVPSDYYTLVDANTGNILYRVNRVMHHKSGESCKNPGRTHMMGYPPRKPFFDVQATVSGEVYMENPYGEITEEPLANLYVNVGGVNYPTDETGFANIPADPGTQAQVRLAGEWCRIYTNDVTPGTTILLQAGNNDISMNAFATIKERSAYRSVQAIHDHMKFWMPDFTDMDFQLPTNVDVSGECNAFYDGASINFFNIGGGCNATSLIADVVYHEYGHGINGTYYSSVGSQFSNGAMNEGYADYWAISLSNNPHLGQGFYTDSEDGIRRYDVDPKRYPEDIVGEVHADGEIICGAWWDTHLLMGADWNITMPIFVEAFAGLQANTFDGNEGQAFTDVLIDALQADDNDGDISNGTPNGMAIVEGFDMHGITLLSNAELYHNDLTAADDDTDITIEATLDLTFPFTNYLSDVKLYYRINDGNWDSMGMTNTGGDNYEAVITGQPKGTLIAYYLGTTDINGLLSNVQPIGAQLDPHPNLPYFILVGVEEVGRHDCDDNEDWGSWQTSVVGDNATTGIWVLDIPVGSFSTPGDLNTVVQTYYQNTPGGEYCFVTGNAANEASGLGENDVDAGRTTLQTAIIEMSEYDNPIVTYQRWYTNSPPSGANPGADWWQVRLSNDGGVNWIYIENTLTGEIGWRRNAFRVADYLEITDEMRMQFIASDSTTVGEYLDGGSLIEAALDDFIIYEEEADVSVNETDGAIEFLIYPNPASTEVFVDADGVRVHSVRVFNSLGALVYFEQFGNLGQDISRKSIPLANLADGVYTMMIDIGEDTVRENFTIRK
ncbi:MAG: hypothetical protein RL220_2059 [Bacteroidota bacterium]